MFYRGQLCELYFQILDHKQSRRPPQKNFPSDLRHRVQTVTVYMATQNKNLKSENLLILDRSHSFVHSFIHFIRSSSNKIACKLK